MEKANMIDISKLFMSGSKVIELSSNNDKQKSSSRRPRLPTVVKYSCWGLWTILVLYLLYKQDSMNYALLIGRIVWFVALIVSLRDGGIHLSSVEYNCQTKNLVGMISYAASLWLLTNRIRIYDVKSIEYCALGILAGYQSFDSPFAIMYCRPMPIKQTKWNVIEDYVSLPIFLSMMLFVESVDDNSSIYSNNIISTFQVIISAIALYRFVRVYFEYQQITSLTTETIPLKHQFTTTLDSTVKAAGSIDGTSINIWRIYGNTYDMTAYVEDHPGGVEAIMLGANREDCTALFQSYHPFNIQKAKSVLEKYRIADPKKLQSTLRNGSNGAATSSSLTTRQNDTSNPNAADEDRPVKHGNDLFYDLLCQRVEKVLKDEYDIDPIKDRTPTTIRYGYYLFLLVAVVSSCIAHCKGSLLGSFLFGVFGWLLGAIGHDGGHYAVSHVPQINDFAVWGMSMLCNPIMWQHQHTYAHHSYTNEFEHDPDLHHFDMFLRYHKRFIILHPVYKNQTSKLFVLFAYAFTCFGQCYYIPIRFIQERSLYGTVMWSDRNRSMRMILLFAHFILYSAIVMFLPFFVHKSTLIASIASLLPMATSGILFALCSQVGHVTELCTLAKDKTATIGTSTTSSTGTTNKDSSSSNTIQKDPKVNTIITKDSWAVGQIESTNDFCPQSSLWHVLANGLTLQVEHHLFPGLNHCHLMKIQPIVEQTCLEYGVQYKKYNSWNSVMDATFDYLNKLALE